jgi:uncharacterized protein YecT (DUF1311 family)
MRLPRAFSAVLLLLPAVILPAVILPSEAAQAQSVAWDAERCEKDPRFRVGGGAIGDCLLELSARVDRRIASSLRTGEARYPLAEDRVDYRRIQSDWETYRNRMCELVRRSPDNTPSSVSAAACRLELGRQRLSVLRYTNAYGTPRSAN